MLFWQLFSSYLYIVKAAETMFIWKISTFNIDEVDARSPFFNHVNIHQSKIRSLFYSYINLFFRQYYVENYGQIMDLGKFYGLFKAKASI